MSFIHSPLDLDLDRNFTVLAWAQATNTNNHRTIFSVESPFCSIAIFSVYLNPKSMLTRIAYMISNEERCYATDMPTVPGPGVFFHIALVSEPTTFTLYVNGARTVHQKMGPLYNPGQPVCPQSPNLPVLP
jgi:hypothetical protein